MEITIKGGANEVSALVLAVQERQVKDPPTLEQLVQAVHAALENCGPVSMGDFGRIQAEDRDSA